MSGTEWRFTDGDGAERTVGTEELRASLASGKVPPSTLVWRDGMVEWQPAFTLPELSSAAIAAARPKSIPPGGRNEGGRSAPPPLPARKPRGVARTLTGIEPPDVLEAMGLGKRPTDSSEDSSQERRELAPLGDDDDWDSTDIIPKAPPLPRDVKLVAPRALSSSGINPKDDGKRTTLLGFGSGNRASRPPVGPAPRTPIRAPAPSPKVEAAKAGDQSGRSKPPPPPTRPKSVAPPPPRRLSKTLEIETKAAKSTEETKLANPNAARSGLRSKPPPAPPLKTKVSASAETPIAPSVADPKPKAQPRAPSSPTLNVAAAGLEPTALSTPAPVIEEAPKSSLAQEKTDLLVGVGAPPSETKPETSAAESKSDAPPRSRTLEMALDDHSVASQKNPAPPEVPAAKPEKSEKKRSPSAVPAEPRRQKLDRETTDATAAKDTTEVPSDRPRSKRKAKNAVEVPVRSVLGVSAAWVLGLIAFFFVGRVSGFKSAAKLPEAREGVSDAFLLQSPPPPVAAEAAKPKPIPCWSARRPMRYAASASKQVGFDMRAVGGSMLLGYAVDEKKAAALKIDPTTGKFEEVFKKDTENSVVRVTPLPQDGAFYVAEKGDVTFYPVTTGTPFYVSISKSSIGVTSAPDVAPKEIWATGSEDPIVAEQVLAVGDQFLLSFRQGNTVMGGYFGADGSAKTPLFKVVGSDGKSGKPRAGTNGQEVAIAFADKPADDAAWQIRLGRSAAGAPIESAPVLELPKGGPGGDAIAPDVVGLSNGRWLLMWTEGSAGERAIQAQTFDATFTPIGDPIALSPPAGNFGQAMLGVVGTYTDVAFLQAAEDGFELWGAVLQCDL